MLYQELRRIQYVLRGFSKSQQVFACFQRSQQNFRCLTRILEVVGGFIVAFDKDQQDFEVFIGFQRSVQDLGGFSRIIEVLYKCQQDFRSLSRQDFQGLSRILGGSKWSQQDYTSQQDFRRLTRIQVDLVGSQRCQQDLIGFSRFIDVFACFQQDFRCLNRILEVLGGGLKRSSIRISKILEVLAGFSRIIEVFCKG